MPTARTARRRIPLLLKRTLPLSLLLACGSAMAQLPEYKATIAPRAGENVAQPCDYRALFPAGDRKVRAAWVTYDRGPDITSFYSDPEVMAFAKRNDLAMVLAIQCPAKHASEQGEMDMYPEHGLGRSLFSALTKIGMESHQAELGNAKLIVLGFSGTGAYFGHFVAFAPSRVLAAILTNPGTDDPNKLAAGLLPKVSCLHFWCAGLSVDDFGAQHKLHILFPSGGACRIDDLGQMGGVD